ncbi:MAG: peptidase S8, partial [Lysobacter sp.]
MSSRFNTTTALAAATALVLGASMFTSAHAGGRANLATLEPDSKTFSRFILKFRSGTAPRTDVASFNRALGSAATSFSSSVGGGKHGVQLKRLRRMATGSDVVLSDRPLDRAEAVALMQRLAADPNIETVENDVRLVPYLTPNDTRFSEQYGFGTGNGGIRATTAWDVTKGAGVVVAVIDTGITNHSDLNANVIAGYDFISADDPADGLPGNGFFIANDGDGRDANPADPGDWYTT